MASTSKKNGVSLGIETLEGRAMPAYLSGGNLQIVGSDAADNVKVQDLTVNGAAIVRVTHNGYSQDFGAAAVTGRVMFWGYGGNDSFDYYGAKTCYADGGSGNDYLSADRGT